MPTISRLVSLMRETSVLSLLAVGGLHGRLVIGSRMGHSRLLSADFAHSRSVLCAGPANFQQTKDENGNYDQNEGEGEGRVDVVIEHDLAHLTDVLRRCEHFAFRERGPETTGVRQEANRRVVMEHLLQTGGQRTDQQP